MDEDSDASITIDTILSGEYSIYGITVNYQPLILIFCTILLAKILRNITTPLSSWVCPSGNWMTHIQYSFISGGMPYDVITRQYGVN